MSNAEAKEYTLEICPICKTDSQQTYINYCNYCGEKVKFKEVKVIAIEEYREQIIKLLLEIETKSKKETEFKLRAIEEIRKRFGGNKNEKIKKTNL